MHWLSATADIDFGKEVLPAELGELGFGRQKSAALRPRVFSTSPTNPAFFFISSAVFPVSFQTCWRMR
jgi:hypothetical protein